jgi:hypothetical protein
MGERKEGREGERKEGKEGGRKEGRGDFIEHGKI